jgi:prepilin-type N-terminal cleavage/methylation domain-containing protein
MKKSSNKGFTLVELIIVIAILAIIMLIAIPNFSGIQQRMQVRADKATAAQIGKAVRVWFTDYTTDPTMPTEKTKGETPVDKVKPAGLGTPSGSAGTVSSMCEYSDLSYIKNYISEGQTAKSLLDGDGKNITGHYCVFLTADSTDATAKIAVAICPAGNTTTNIAGVAADKKVTAAYDGNTAGTTNGAGVAYVEP